LRRAVDLVDGALDRLARVFLVIANACLALMLIGTAATIVLRPFDLSYYWIWPWTMQFFVWMSFVGFYVVYRYGKDIAVDFVVLRMGTGAMAASRFFVDAVVLAVMGTILAQMPTILESQVGVIDGVVTPWGELERYTLSIPLGVSCALIFLNTALDVAKACIGIPEAPHSHLTDPDS
jgi:TRAP-type C4-dicarboxylate transport system permease small subunit